VTIDNPGDVAQLAEFGVVFLLFMIGLELSWERLKSLRRYVFGLGALQVALSLAIIAGVALAFGQPPGAAIAIGAAWRSPRRPSSCRSGRAEAPAFAGPGRPSRSCCSGPGGGADPDHAHPAQSPRQPLSPNLLLDLAPAVLGVVALLAAGRLVLRPMMRSVAGPRRGLFLAACLLVVIGAGLVSALTGLSMA
jgi:CPA2 family monovalent cation:H+ antiporter-2